MLDRKSSLVILLACLAVSLAGGIKTHALQLGSREATEWIDRLERPGRIAGLKRDEVVAHLKLRPGNVVADIGAGAGAFSLHLARAVAPSGKLLAVDIEQGLLDHINQVATQANVSNIQTVLGGFDNPNLPTRQVDLAFFHDVLHHVENRAAYLKALASYMKPNGRIAIIELDKTRPDVPHRNQPEMQVGKEEVNQWLAAAGFYPAEEFNMFEDKWFIVYARGGAATSGGM